MSDRSMVNLVDLIKMTTFQEKIAIFKYPAPKTENMPIKMTHTSWQLIRMRLQTPASGPRSPKLISYIYICANMFGKIRLAIRVSMLTASETQNCSTKIYIKTAPDDEEDLPCAWVSNSWWLGYFWPPHDAPLIGQASIFYLWVYFKSSSLNLYLY